MALGDLIDGYCSKNLGIEKPFFFEDTNHNPRNPVAVWYFRVDQTHSYREH